MPTRKADAGLRKQLSLWFTQWTSSLLALIIVVVIGATRQHSRSWPGRPGWQYQRVLLGRPCRAAVPHRRRHRLGSESQPRMVPRDDMGGRTRVVADRTRLRAPAAGDLLGTTRAVANGVAWSEES
jgi:hypothetical protein